MTDRVLWERATLPAEGEMRILIQVVEDVSRGPLVRLSAVAPAREGNRGMRGHWVQETTHYYLIDQTAPVLARWLTEAHAIVAEERQSRGLP